MAALENTKISTVVQCDVCMKIITGDYRLRDHFIACNQCNGYFQDNNDCLIVNQCIDLDPNPNPDSLSLSSNNDCLSMLYRFGDNSPDPEKVILSTSITKLNRSKTNKTKAHNRTLLLTDKALYNLRASNYRNCRNRLDYKHIHLRE